ncbi:MAG TPA: hypothetical protein VHZ50_08620 [Puia sp.]|jgi:hypothetical protein|nr:hypothetical protein [Puia sp.]
MKHNNNELDVDFIGGLGPLTKQEEKAISAFIAASKKRKLKTRQKAKVASKNILTSLKN